MTATSYGQSLITLFAPSVFSVVNLPGYAALVGLLAIGGWVEYKSGWCSPLGGCRGLGRGFLFSWSLHYGRSSEVTVAERVWRWLRWLLMMPADLHFAANKENDKWSIILKSFDWFEGQASR